MEKYITFSVPIKKECEDGKTITCKLRFTDSFMSTSLSELVENMSGIFNSIECKLRIEKIKINSECCFFGLKNNRLNYKCKECNEEWKRPINEIIETLPGIYQFCSGDLNKFVLLLQKGVYPYEYMDSWKKLMKLNYHLKKIFIVI